MNKKMAILIIAVFCLLCVGSYMIFEPGRDVTYHQINLTNSSILELFYISSILIPFILPRMHERYFYIADVLSVLVFFYDRKRFYVPLITILSSMSSYFAFLLGQNVFEQKYTALALLILIILSLKKYIEGVKKPVWNSKKSNLKQNIFIKGKNREWH